MQAVIKSPLWKSMPHEVHFAARQWFGKAVMTPGQIALLDAADPELVYAELFALGEEDEEEKQDSAKEAEELDEAAKQAIAAADVKAAVAALQAAVENIAKSPVRIEIPRKALDNLAALDPAVFADATALSLMLKLIDQLKVVQPTPNFGKQFLAAVTQNRDPLVLHRAAPFLWAIVNRNHRTFNAVKDLTVSLVDDHPSAASACVNAGLDAIARHRGHTYYNKETDIPLLQSNQRQCRHANGPHRHPRR